MATFDCRHKIKGFYGNKVARGIKYKYPFEHPLFTSKVLNCRLHVHVHTLHDNNVMNE